MKSTLLIITLIFLHISCSEKNDNTSILNGEWISDSLATKRNDHWREFLYFENGNLLAQTTWWGPKYILNKNLKLNNLSFQNDLGDQYEIKIIDNSNLEIRSKDYYGKFKKESYQPDNIKAEVIDFERAETNREKFLGNWKLTKIQKRLQDNKLEKDSIYNELIKSSDFDKLLNFQTDLIEGISMDSEYFKFNFKSKKEYKFSYILRFNSIDIYSGDMIYKLEYKLLENNNLVITNYNRIGIYTDVYFKK